MQLEGKLVIEHTVDRCLVWHERNIDSDNQIKQSITKAQQRSRKPPDTYPDKSGTPRQACLKQKSGMRAFQQLTYVQKKNRFTVC